MTRRVAFLAAFAAAHALSGNAAAQSAEAGAAVQASSVSGSAAVDVPVEPDAPDAGYDWALVHRRYSGRAGSTGGLFVPDPDSGVPGSLRIQLLLDGAPRDDFLRDGTEISQNRQSLAVSWTPLAWLELFGTLHNRGTGSSDVDVPAQHALGEWAFGAKAFAEVWPLVHAGGGLRIALRDSADGDAIDLGATNAEVTGAISVDLREARTPTPFVARFAMTYLFDNSAQAVENVELARYVALEDAGPMFEEDAHLVTRFERYALGINRTDQLQVGLGFETPFEVVERMYVHPLLEARLGVPVNRQGFDCPIFTDVDDAGTPASDRDSCVAAEGLSAWPLRLAIGARVVPPVEGLSFLVALDWGVTATDRFVHELAPQAPVVILAGLSFDLDGQPAPPPDVVEVPAPVPPRGRVRGTVLDEANERPIADARVRVIDAGLGALASDEDGRFTSYLLDPGEVVLEVSHPAYVSARCKAVVPEAGGDVDARCELAVRRDLGRIEGRIVDAFGMPVAGAVVRLEGVENSSVTTDPEGRFVRADLGAGTYRLRAETGTHLVAARTITLAENEQRRLDVVMIPRPAVPAVRIRGQKIVADALRFASGSTELDAEARMAVMELADLLLRTPVLRIRVDVGGEAVLAPSRTKVVTDALVAAGVEATRVEMGTATGAADRVDVTLLP